MVQKLKAEGFEQFQTVISEVENKNPNGDIFILFSGSKDTTGQSWCPDCVEAEPVIEKALESAPEDAIFIYVGVGDRSFWKDPNCVFRLDGKIKLTCVPTLIKWGTNKRLLDYQCNNLDTVLMMFED
ncbi:thioredoxin domain-containing protein 17-like [Daphnia carinata]|uniref:thioredoxin domain-containing protein 17-like n=1 Tax=Daphnia carinata TaxID=120202 RepID=UPI00257C4C38|nr:thioredoxin domain-containing protein 17-like [Daphnia carinata]